MTLVELTEQAREQLARVTGLKPVLVSAMFKDDQGWHVFVDMLEMRRIPDSTDILGYYEVLLNEDGGMVNFRRKRSHLRGERIEEEDCGN